MKHRGNGLAVAVRRALAVSVLGAALAACGGGGGGGNTVRADPPPAALPRPVVYTPLPEYSAHLALTNTAAAHAAGLTGAGIRIGVVDSGVNRNHPALQGRVLANLVYISSNGNNLAVDDVVGHGTAVAQIAAGRPFGAWPGGIAPGAGLVSARIISDKPPSDDGSGQGNEVDGALGLKSIHQDLINRGVRIMNNSWGGLYWTNLNATALIADEYRPFIASNGGLVVFATGNEGGANPSSMAALPSQPGPNETRPAADLERGWLAVTAVDPTDIHSLDKGSNGAVYANACGVAMRYCLAAPGTVITTGTDDAYNNPQYWRWKGTSFAAPQVSGAAALVWQKFPYFNNDLVRQTLLGTAKDIGAAGVDPVFGYGLLDVGAAVQGPARFDWGDVTVSFAGTSTWANPISGAGGLIKQGSGRLELTQANSYQGATSVQGGTLASHFTVPGNAFVSAGANLELRGGVAGHLDNLGTVTSKTTASHEIGGNYHQGSNARFAFEIGAPLRVAGQATIDGGDAQVIGIAQGYARSSRETVLTAGGGVNGQFSTLSAGSGVFLQATLGYDPNTVWLDITRLDVTATSASLGFSPASLSGATRVEGAFDAIDGGNGGNAGGGVSNDFLRAAGAIQRSPTAMAAEHTLASLSGEMHGADTAYALLAIEGSRQALERRLDEGRDMAAGGAWADRVSGQRGVRSHMDVDAHGWALGQDWRVGDRLTVGGALAETRALAWHDVRMDREANRQVEGQAYAAWQLDGGLYAFGRAAYGRMDRQTRRSVWLGDADFGLGSDYAARYASVALQVGQRFGGAPYRFTPYLGLQSVQLDRDGFREDGAAGFGLVTGDSRMRLTQGLLGARFDQRWNTGATRWSVHGHAEWQRVLAQSGTDIDARFSGIDFWSPIMGEAVSRDVARVGVGVQADWRRGGALRLGLDGRRDHGRTWTQARLDWAVGF